MDHEENYIEIRFSFLALSYRDAPLILLKHHVMSFLYALHEIHAFRTVFGLKRKYFTMMIPEKLYYEP